MTIEEKAKAYDKAIEKAKNCLKDGTITNTAISYIGTIFPELKESKDEKIRKTIIKFIENQKEEQCHYKGYGGLSWNEMLAWLEKQGEQKSTLPKWKYKTDNTPLLRDSLILNKYGCVAKSPSGAIVSDVWVIDYDELAKLPKEEIEKQGEQKSSDKVVPKFENGQWIVWQDKCYKVNDNGCGYELVDQDGLSTSLEYGTIDENAHIWDITKDAKDGDVLVYHNTATKIIMLFKSWIIEREAASTHFHIFDNDCRVDDWCDCGKNAHPATKEQHDTLERAMTNAGYRWNKEELKLEKI